MDLTGAAMDYLMMSLLELNQALTALMLPCPAVLV